MSLRLIIFFILFCCSVIAVPTEYEKSRYGNKIYEAFLLQANGKTREAYNLFKSGYQGALSSGEDKRRMFVIQELFIWYRKYGYSLGIMSVPSNCSGEVFKAGRNADQNGNNQYSSQPYQSEWGKDPIQSGKIRDAMVGFSEIISAALMFAVGTPQMKAFAFPVGWDGFTRIWGACNSLYVDYECQALSRLKEIEQEARAIK